MAEVSFKRDCVTGLVYVHSAMMDELRRLIQDTGSEIMADVSF
jgi:hypothetical protein